MTKVELKKKIAEQQAITQKLAEEYIDAVFSAIKEGLIEDGKVQVYGIVNFEVKDTKPSSGVINGIEWSKEAGKRVSAKISKAFESEILGE
jgi:nucleoid DNA-binding protein